MRPKTLTAKLTLLTGLLATFIILATGLLFSTSYKFLVGREIKTFLAEESREIVREHLAFADGRIQSRVNSDGVSLSSKLRTYDLSAVIFDARINRLGSYGVYRNFPDALIPDITKTDPSAFSVLSPSPGLTFTTFTVPLIASGSAVGFVQFAKDSSFQNRLLGLNFTAMAFLLPLVILATWVVLRSAIRRSLQPLNYLVSHLRRAPSHQLLQKVTLPGQPTDEISELAYALNDMLDRIGDSLTRQKDFIAHASHELRTPLTQAISSLDLAVMSKNTRRCSEYVTQVKSDLFELNQILDSLLSLSRLDDPLAAPPAAANFYVRPIIEKLIQSSLSNSLTVTIHCPPESRLNFPKEHFQIILSNLISNAIKYNQPGGQVTISFDGSALSVSNTGPGIPKSDQNKVFDRFYRPQSSGNTRGSGLGLALVKRICELHHISLHLASDSTGTTFTLNFPM